MKKVIAGFLFLLMTTNASANFFGGNDGEWKMGPHGPYWEESDWPQWTPMYWMQEMMDSFDDEGNNFGGMMPGGNKNFGGMMPGNNGFNNMPQFGMQPQYRMQPYAMPTMPNFKAPTPAVPQAQMPAIAQ